MASAKQTNRHGMGLRMDGEEAGVNSKQANEIERDKDQGKEQRDNGQGETKSCIQITRAIKVAKNGTEKRRRRRRRK